MFHQHGHIWELSMILKTAVADLLPPPAKQWHLYLAMILGHWTRQASLAGRRPQRPAHPPAHQWQDAKIISTDSRHDEEDLVTWKNKKWNKSEKCSKANLTGRHGHISNACSSWPNLSWAPGSVSFRWVWLDLSECTGPRKGSLWMQMSARDTQLWWRTS